MAELEKYLNTEKIRNNFNDFLSHYSRTKSETMGDCLTCTSSGVLKGGKNLLKVRYIMRRDVNYENHVIQDDELVIVREFFNKSKYACLYVQNEDPHGFKVLNHVWVAK